MKCRICGNSMVEEQKVPVKDNRKWIISSVARPYKEKQMPVYYCEKCQHRQIDYVMDDSYYMNHDSIMEGDKQYFGSLNNKERYIKTIKKYISAGCILDVGCGQGDFLRVASKYFDYCCGIEPSSASYEKRFRDMNIEYINDYFGSNLSIPQYDAIVSFQVLEHVVDVNGFVKAFHKYMKDDGIGVINVPNGNEVFIKPCFSQIVMQHVNYFSIYSLVALLNYNGFEILEIDNDISKYEITVYFRKVKKEKNICACIDDLKHTLNNELCEYYKIAVWGAGGRAASYAGLLQKKIKKNILHIFDNDEKKHNGYIAGLDISIEKPNKNKIKEMQAIIIFASAYNQEIIKELNELYEYDGKIIYIENDKICTWED